MTLDFLFGLRHPKHFRLQAGFFLFLDPFFGDPKVPISITDNDGTLVEVLGLTPSTMIRAFPADNISILMAFIAFEVVTVMIGGPTNLDLLFATFGDTSTLYVDTVLVTANRARTFHRGGFHLCCVYADATQSALPG